MLQKERFKQPEKQQTLKFVLFQLQRNLLIPVFKVVCMHTRKKASLK